MHKCFLPVPPGCSADIFHFTKCDSHLGLASMEVKGQKLAFIIDFKIRSVSVGQLERCSAGQC